MIKVSVRADIDAMKASLSGMRKEVNIAAARALDRVSVTARKVADQKIRERTNLASAVVKNNISVEYPYGRRALIRDIAAVGSAIPLRDYKATQTKQGAKFAVVRGQRKLFKREGRPGFILRRKGGHVFVRTEDDPPGPRKGRIKKVFGPSISQRFYTRRVTDAIEATVNERWPIEFDREIKFRKSKLA